MSDLPYNDEPTGKPPAVDVTCPSCMSEDGGEYTVMKNIFVTSDGYITFQCANCGTIFNLDATNPYDKYGLLNIGILEDEDDV